MLCRPRTTGRQAKGATCQVKITAILFCSGPPRCRSFCHHGPPFLCFILLGSRDGHPECWKVTPSILGMSRSEHSILYFIFRCLASALSSCIFRVSPEFSAVLARSTLVRPRFPKVH